ncbi:30S ribosomal protein S5 [Candidatus Microgenomates bacterium]|nr:30S ribosomal protein S5 [Candidatus Microgenomates bacterium]
MSDDKIIKTSKDIKLEEEKEADIAADIEDVIVKPQEAPVLKVEEKIGRGGKRSHDGRSRAPREKEPSEFEEKMLAIDRVTRVVKGGRRMRFRALVVIGDKKGRVGFGLGKGNEVAGASAKAINRAKKRLLHVEIIDGTILHDTYGHSRGSDVLLKSAKKGRGIIAGGSVRTVLDLAGFSDVVAKSFGSSNKINTVRATMDALMSLRSDKKNHRVKREKVEEKKESPK